MKISTKGRYALRLMLDLAMDTSGEPVRIKDVAERQEISVKYLEQIVSILAKAGYVRSIRGPQGGYRLSREPEDYTVGMILRIIEGSLAPVACLESGDCSCARESQCVTVEVYRQIDAAIDAVVDSITLKDLVAMQQEKWGRAPQT